MYKLKKKIIDNKEDMYKQLIFIDVLMSLWYRILISRYNRMVLRYINSQDIRSSWIILILLFHICLMNLNGLMKICL